MPDNHFSMQYVLRAIVLMGLLVVAGCQFPFADSKDDEVDLVNQGVTITSYNYTDRALNDVTVDGVWTGGAHAYSLGGGAAGLLAPKDRSHQHSVKVKWEVQDYYDVKTNRYLRPAPRPESHEALVPIDFPYPERMNYLILHFYPDGHVEAELTERMPEQRIPPPEGFQL